jgi:drug/metabolite transporter (DMT)-like permease
MRTDIPLGFWLLAFVSVGLSTAAQLLMKSGMSLPSVRTAMAGGPGQALVAMFANPQVIGGLAAYGVGAVLWLLCLSRIPLVMAYPLVSLAIVGVILSSVFLLGESVSITGIIGSMLVVAGVALIGFSR